MTTLRDEFDKTHTKQVSGIDLTYISWSQAADRLDEAAPEDWQFSIIAIGPDWVHGRLTIGNRGFENIGYAENAEASWKKEVLKDAASDAFKRCAALAGVGRYLYDKDSSVGAPARSSGNGRAAAPPPPARPPADPYADLPPEWDAGAVNGGKPATGRSSASGKADNSECPIHGVTWAGEWGDLWHKTDDPEFKGYCRHPENTRGPVKARR